MLYVDDREGSGQLAPLLRAKGLPVTVCRSSFGDISFMGVGAGGCPVPVGVEVKTISDVLKCVTDGRFAGHQLPGLVNSYDQIWLLIEGTWRPNPQTGVLETLYGGEKSGRWRDATVGSRRFMYKDLHTWLLTLQTKAGLNVVRCGNWGEAILWLSTLYNWWTSKLWEDHRAHLAIHSPVDSRFFDRAILVRPSLCRMVATELPGVGYDKSGSLASFFGTVENLVQATEWELAQVPGIGPGLARKIYYSIRSKS